MSPYPKSQIQKLLLLGMLYVRLYMRPVVIWVKLNEDTFEKCPEAIHNFLHVFKHNEIFLTMKCFESCMYAST